MLTWADAPNPAVGWYRSWLPVLRHTLWARPSFENTRRETMFDLMHSRHLQWGEAYKETININRRVTISAHILKDFGTPDEPLLLLSRRYTRNDSYRQPLLAVRSNGDFMVPQTYWNHASRHTLTQWSFLDYSYVTTRTVGWAVKELPQDRITLLRSGYRGDVTGTDMPYVEIEDVSDIWLRLVPGLTSPYEWEHDTAWMIAAQVPQYKPVAGVTTERAEQLVRESYDRARARRRRVLRLSRRDTQPVSIKTPDGTLTAEAATRRFAEALTVEQMPSRRSVHASISAARPPEAP